MLEEPYRWVEAVRNRREYVDEQLRPASPVVGLRYADGVLLLTTTPGPRKLFEVHDQLAFAAIGHPADIEKLRRSLIDVAHLEGFNYSARDVSLPRLVHFGLGPLMKAAFDEIFRSPFIARVLVAELDAREEEETFYAVDADGSFHSSRWVGAVAGTAEGAALIRRRLAGPAAEQPPLAAAAAAALTAWAAGRLMAEGQPDAEPDEARAVEYLKRDLGEQRVEAAVLDRCRPPKTRFRRLSATELAPVLAPFAG